jgi:predicted MFS family arabinose efflux permease
MATTISTSSAQETLLGVSSAPDSSARSSARAYWTAWAATLIFFAGFYTLLVPLPRYLAQIGLADWQIGLILGAFGVASLLWRTVAGVAVDRWGSKPVMLLGTGSLVVGAVCTVLTESPSLLFGLRLLQAAGYVAFTTAGTALIIELTPEAERGRRLAIFGAAANVAITLAPAAATALLAVVPLEVGFWLTGALAFLGGALAALISAPLRPSRPPRSFLQGWRFPRILWLPMTMSGLFGAGFAAFFLFAPILSERRDVPPGLLYTVYGIGIIASRIVGSRWLDRTGTGRTLLLSAIIVGSGLGLAAVAATPFWLGLASLVIAAGSGLFHPVLIAHHARLVPGAPGQATAGFYLGFDLGIGLGSWLLGLILDLAGLTWLYLVAALLVLLTMPLLPALLRQAETVPSPARTVASGHARPARSNPRRSASTSGPATSGSPATAATPTTDTASASPNPCSAVEFWDYTGPLTKAAWQWYATGTSAGGQVRCSFDEGSTKMTRTRVELGVWQVDG